jgi:hypothetical protein
MPTKSFEINGLCGLKEILIFSKNILTQVKDNSRSYGNFCREKIWKCWKRSFKRQSCRYLWVQDVEKAATQKSDYLARLEKENGETQANLRAVKDQ